MAGDSGGLVEGDVADGFEFAVCTGPPDSIHADVDDCCAGFDFFGGDEAWDAGGGDQDICAAAVFFEVRSPLVATDDRCVVTHEKDRDGLADDVARADDDGDFASQERRGHFFAEGFVEAEVRAVDVFDHFHDGESGAGGEAAFTVDDVADVCGVDAFDVFLDVDQTLHVIGIDAFGQWDVHHDRVASGIGGEGADLCGDGVFGGTGGQAMQDVFDADFFAGFGLIFGVDAGTVVAAFGENCVEFDEAAGVADGLRAEFYLLAQACGEGVAVDDFGGGVLGGVERHRGSVCRL